MDAVLQEQTEAIHTRHTNRPARSGHVCGLHTGPPDPPGAALASRQAAMAMPEADWPKAYLPFYSEPSDDPWLCRHVKLVENRLVSQTYIESAAHGRQMYLQARKRQREAQEA